MSMIKLKYFLFILKKNIKDYNWNFANAFTDIKITPEMAMQRNIEEG